MYMIEVTEDKVDNLIEHMGKGLRCFSKAMECLEEMKEGTSGEERYDDDDHENEEYNERYGNRGGRSGNARDNVRRFRAGGRYSRY